jgi:hypothetical protein
MSTYVLAYTGGSMPETDEARAAVMESWGAWFGGLGSAVVDPGNPFGASASVAGDGSVSDGAAGALTGYSIITADDLSAATAAAKDCPILAGGNGAIQVYEVVPAM